MAQTGLPEWVLWVQALGPTAMSAVTALVAGTVALIAYRQWRTAQDNLVLSLFDRRYTVYLTAKKGVEAIIRDGYPKESEPIWLIAEARGEAEFLFGDEIKNYLASIQQSMAQLGLARNMMDSGDTSADWPKITHDEFLKVSAFHEDFPRLAAPYMRMTQKMS